MSELKTLDKLEYIEQHRIIYAILYRRAGVAFQFYIGDHTEENFRNNLTVDHYYPDFSSAVDAEYKRLIEDNPSSP